jgi:hypothetical protein
MSIYFLIIPWVLLALLVGWIASKRGRSAITWGLLSLFLSPSVLAVLVALPQRVRV